MQLANYTKKWLWIILVLSCSQLAQSQSLVGQKAPSITLENLVGDRATLSNLQGKYVLLNFWATWHLESELQLATLQTFRQKYADFGFEVFNIALDEDVNAWLRACRDKHLAGDYQCVSKGRFESYCALDYGINKLPASFLISPDGTIVEENPSYERVEVYLTGRSAITEQYYTTYIVSLGNFGSLHFHNAFMHLSHLGPINADKLSETDYLVWIGPFTDYASVQYAVEEAKKKGYSKAQSLQFKNNSLNNPIQPSQSVAAFTPPTNTNKTVEEPIIKYTTNTLPVASTIKPSENATFTPATAPITPAFTPAATPANPTLALSTTTKSGTVETNLHTQNAYPKFEDKSKSSSTQNTDTDIVVTLPVEKDNGIITRTQFQEPKKEDVLPAEPWNRPNMPAETPKITDTNTNIDYNPYGVKEDTWSASGYNVINNVADSAPNPTYQSITSNRKIKQNIQRLERRKKRHANKTNKIETRIRNIEQDALIKSVYGKSKK